MKATFRQKVTSVLRLEAIRSRKGALGHDRTLLDLTRSSLTPCVPSWSWRCVRPATARRHAARVCGRRCEANAASHDRHSDEHGDPAAVLLPRDSGPRFRADAVLAEARRAARAVHGFLWDESSRRDGCSCGGEMFSHGDAASGTRRLSELGVARPVRGRTDRQPDALPVARPSATRAAAHRFRPRRVPRSSSKNCSCRGNRKKSRRTSKR